MNKNDLQVLAGRNLQRCRTNAKLTQEQVAEKAGISTSFYTNLERGRDRKTSCRERVCLYV